VDRRALAPRRRRRRTATAQVSPDAVFDESDTQPVSVSWKAVFDSVTHSADSESPCETSTGLTIDDNDWTP